MDRDALNNLLLRVGSRLDSQGQPMSDLQARLEQLDQNTPALTRRQALSRVAQMSAYTLQQSVVTPLSQGLQLPFNPMNFGYTLGNAAAIADQFNSLDRQTSAFLNGGPTRAYDPASVQRFSASLSSIGATKGETLQYMQQLAVVSQQLSSNLDRATVATQNFAKANGIDAGQAINMAGTLSRNMGVALDKGSANQMLENLRGMAGGNMARVEPLFQAVAALQEGTIQSGQMVQPGRMFVDNAMQMLGGFQRLNPELYGSRPDVAIQGMGQMRQMGKGALLGFAMDAASAAGLSTDITDVYAMLEANDPRLMEPLMNLARGDRGMSDFLSMSGVNAGMVRDLRDKGFTAGISFNPMNARTPEQQAADAEKATTGKEKLVANYTNSLQDTNAAITRLTDGFSDAVADFATYTKLLLASGVVGAMMNPAVRELGRAGLGYLAGTRAGQAVTGAVGGAINAARGAFNAGRAGGLPTPGVPPMPPSGMTTPPIVAPGPSGAPGAPPPRVGNVTPSDIINAPSAGAPNAGAAARAGMMSRVGGFLGTAGRYLSNLPGYAKIAGAALTAGALYYGYNNLGDGSDSDSDEEDWDVQLKRLQNAPLQRLRGGREAGSRVNPGSAAAGTVSSAKPKTREEFIQRLKEANARGDTLEDDTGLTEAEELRKAREQLKKEFNASFTKMGFARSDAAQHQARLNNPGSASIDKPNSHRLNADGTSRSGDYAGLINDATGQPFDMRTEQLIRKRFEALTPTYNEERSADGVMHMQLDDSLARAAQQTAMSLQMYSQQMDNAVLQQRYASASFLIPGTRLY